MIPATIDTLKDINISMNIVVTSLNRKLTTMSLYHAKDYIKSQICLKISYLHQNQLEHIENHIVYLQ